MPYCLEAEEASPDNGYSPALAASCCRCRGQPPDHPVARCTPPAKHAQTIIFIIFFKQSLNKRSKRDTPRMKAQRVVTMTARRTDHPIYEDAI